MGEEYPEKRRNTLTEDDLERIEDVVAKRQYCPVHEARTTDINQVVIAQAKIDGGLFATKLIVAGVGAVLIALISIIATLFSNRLDEIQSSFKSFEVALTDSIKDRGQIRVELDAVKRRLDNLESGLTKHIDQSNGTKPRGW